MKDVFLILILVAILGGALWAMIRSRKKGNPCIGCPDSGHCAHACNGCRQQQNISETE